MSKLGTILKGLAGVAIVIAAGLLLGRLAARRVPMAVPIPTPAPALVSAGDSMASTGAPGKATNHTGRLTPHPSPATGPRVVGPPNPNLITNWDERVDTILVTQEPESEKARKLLEMFPNLPESGQLEVSRHLANLVSDADYASLSKYLTDPSMPTGVLEVLFGDALNRPNSLKLPALLEVARDLSNPNAAQAHDILEMFLEEDYGPDWNLWQAKVDQWLKDNPN